MMHDWLLVETLGDEPVVVAQGDQVKNFVPVRIFLRRNPHLGVFARAVADTVAAGAAVRRSTPDNGLIRTEPVMMSDGRIHGVHIWLGAPDIAPPSRPVPGPLVWNLTTRVATDTARSLLNSGMDPEREQTEGRMFAEDLPTRALNNSETRVLSLAVRNEPGRTFCNTWDVTDQQGNPITVGFVARTVAEPVDGSEHLVARAMNWRSSRTTPLVPQDNLAQRILEGLARPGCYRALVDLNTWTLLKWLDTPCPLYDWRGRAGTPWVHPDDSPALEAMTSELERGHTERVLRLPGHDVDWVALHVTVYRVELEPGTFAGMITLREPTPADLSVHN